MMSRREDRMIQVVKDAEKRRDMSANIIQRNYRKYSVVKSLKGMGLKPPICAPRDDWPKVRVWPC